MSSKNPFKQFPAVSTLVLLEVLTFFAISYQIQVEPRLSLLEKMGLTVISPFLDVSHNVQDYLQTKFQRGKKMEELESENTELKARLENLENVQISLNEERLRSARLEKLLELEQHFPWKLQAAEVIGLSNLQGDAMMIINKGSAHGLQREWGVLCPKGVVGIIWEVSPYYSKVMTINNTSSAIAGMLEQSRYRDAYVSGGGDQTGRLENVPNFINVYPKDIVLTSGLDGIFPKGIPIGTIISAQQTSLMFQEIQVHFQAVFTKLEEVMVVIPQDDSAPEEQP